MSTRCSALFALVLALPAIGCHHPHDRVVPIAQQKPVSEPAVTSQADTSTEPGVTYIAPAQTPAPAPAPAPQAIAPQVITPPVTATPETIVVQQAAPTPAALPPTPPFAPQVRATINDAGVVVPAVPLYLDPGAAPGTPGNGAPDTSTNGQP